MTNPYVPLCARSMGWMGMISRHRPVRSLTNGGHTGVLPAGIYIHIWMNHENEGLGVSDKHNHKRYDSSLEESVIKLLNGIVRH